MTLELTPISPTLLAATRLALRITSTSYDDEISDLIEAVRGQMRTAGISMSVVDAEDPPALVKRAIIVYCKAHFGLDNPDSEKYALSFHSMVAHIALSAEYAQPARTTTGSITAGASELTVANATGIEEDIWLSVAGAASGGALLIARVTAVLDSVVTLDAIAATTVTDAAVKVS